jgi:hypothetical protein
MRTLIGLTEQLPNKIEWNLLNAAKSKFRAIISNDYIWFHNWKTYFKMPA